MGVDLFGKQVLNTYDALIKVGDNDTLTGTAKRLSDGRGNDAPIWLSTARMGINVTPDSSYDLTVNAGIKAGNIDVINALTADTVQLTGGTGTQGTFEWDADENTVALIQNGTTLELGQQVEVHVKNQSGNTIAKGVPVYVTGTLGSSGRLTVAPMIANGTVAAKYFIGVTAEQIANGDDGKVLTFGKIRGLNASSYSEGQTLYVSSSTAGTFQTTAPVSPNLDLEVAIVISVSATVGTIFVRATNGQYLGLLHDVYVSSVTDKDLLVYNSTQSRWENSKTIGDLSAGNLTLSGYLRGAANFVIDPAAYGDETGTVQILGDLRVDGTTTTINSTTVTIDDKNIVLASGSSTSADANGAGITIDGANATITYVSSSDRFVFNKNIETNLVGNVTGNVTGNLTGNVTGNLTGNVTGNADTATNADKVDNKHASDFNLQYVTTNGASTTNEVTIKNTIYSEFGSGNTDITSLLSGSTFGTWIKGRESGHVVIGLRDNDNNDSFAILSGSGNYTTDTTYDKLLARFEANGNITLGGNTNISSGALKMGNLTVIDSSRNITTSSIFAPSTINSGILDINAYSRINLQYNGTTKAYVDSNGFNVSGGLNLGGIDGISLTDEDSTTDSFFHANIDYDGGLYQVYSNTRYGADYIQVDNKDTRYATRFVISPTDAATTTYPALYIGGDYSYTAPETLTDWYRIYINADSVYNYATDYYFIGTNVYINNNEVVTTANTTLQNVTDRGATTTNIITAASFIKSGGTASQFLKANGTVDSSVYLTSYTETDTLNSVTGRGNTTTNSIYISNLVRLTGTTSSTSQLDLPIDYGALRWYDGTTFKGGIGTSGWSGLGTGNDLGFYLNSGDFHIGNGSSEFVTFNKANERVGIGTISPAGKLTVDIDSSGAVLDLKRDDGVNGRLYLTFGSAQSNFYSSGLYTFNVAGSEKMRIDSSGRVSINGLSNGADLTILEQGSTSALLQSTGGLFMQAGSATSLVFQTNGANERMRIDSSGNIGIGTSSPNNKLTVFASAGQATTLANSISNAALYINSDTVNGSNNIRIGESGSGSYFLQVSNSAGTTPYAINLNPFGGNVGIGTTSPSVKLHVESTQAGSHMFRLKNTSTATNGYAEMQIWNDADDKLVLGSIGSGYSGVDWANSAYIYDIGQNALRIKASSQLEFFSGGMALANRRMIINSSGDISATGTLTTAKTINPTKESKSQYALHLRGAFYGAPRLQLYDLSVDSNAHVGLGVDMSGGAYEMNAYFPRYNGYGRFSIGSWAGDFGTGQYVSGYNEKLFITESASQINVPLTVTGSLRAGSSTYDSTPNGTAFQNTIVAATGTGTKRVVNFDGNGGSPSVWWTNGNNAIGAIDALNGTNGLAFWVNSSGGSWQRNFYIDTDVTVFERNVGIGTTSPNVKTEIAGTLYASGGSAWNGGGTEGNKTDAGIIIDEGNYVYTRDSNAYLRKLIGKRTDDIIQIGETGTSLIDGIYFQSGVSGLYRWFSDTTTLMHLDSTGLGIGTTSPNGKFTTVGTYATVTHSLAANSAVSISSMGVDSSNFNAFTIGQANSQNNSAVMRFKYNGAGSTSNYAGFGFYANDDILNIKADGNVGIGTTTPQDKLDVSGNVRITGVGNGLYFDTTGSNASNFIKTINDYETVIANGRGAAGFAVVGNSSIRLGFGTSYTAAQSSIYIPSSGNVGIGTTAPSTKLHIALSGGSGQLTLERTGSGAGKAVLAGAAEGLIVYDDAYGTKMYVGTAGTYNGRVGIGTITPNANLHVYSSGNGEIEVERASGALINLQAQSTIGVIGTDSNHPLYLKTNAGTRLAIATSGNVGIGTTSPNEKLEVAGQVYVNGSQVWSETTQGPTRGTIHIDPASATDHAGGAITWGASDSSNGTTAQAGIYVRSDGSYGTKMYFSTTNSYVAGSKTAMSIDNYGNARSSGAMIANGGFTSAKSTYNMELGSASFSWAGSTVYPTIYGSHADRWVMICHPHIPYLQNGVNGYTGNTSGSAITYASDASTSTYWRAGVRASNDADTFEISRATSRHFWVTSTGQTHTNDWWRTNGGGGVYFQSYGRGLWSTDAQGSSYGNVSTYGSGKNSYQGWTIGGYNVSFMEESNGGGLYDASNGIWRFYYHKSNNGASIGASTTSSSYKLYVSGAIYATGDVVAYSDRRVKENIININSALDKVKALQGVYYNRINDKDKVREIGFIAQDVHDAVPELASYAEDVDEWGVKYSQVTGLHNEAIKELAQELDKKDEQIANLQAQIDELKQLILKK